MNSLNRKMDIEQNQLHHYENKNYEQNKIKKFDTDFSKENHLNLSGKYGSLQDILKILCENTNLNSLSIENRDLSNEDAHELENFLVSIFKNRICKLEDHKSVYKVISIEILNLSNSGLGTKNVILLQNLISSNKNIKVLDLSFNLLEKGIIPLIDSAIKNKLIEVLDLSNNSEIKKYESSDSNEYSYRKRKRILDINFKKKSASASDNYLDTYDFDFDKEFNNSDHLLCTSNIDLNTKHDDIKEINFLGNKIANININMTNVAENKPSKNCCLSTLNLSCNIIEQKETFTIFNKLKLTCMLYDLNMSNCNLQDIAFKYISSFIATNKTLNVLDLSKNNPTTKGIKLLCNSVILNKSLKYLNITGCSQNSSSIKELNKIKTYRHLLEIEFLENDNYFFINKKDKNDSKKLPKLEQISMKSFSKKVNKIGEFEDEDVYFN